MNLNIGDRIRVKIGNSTKRCVVTYVNDKHMKLDVLVDGNSEYISYQYLNAHILKKNKGSN